MINLSGSIQEMIEAEKKLGRSDTVINTAIKNAVEKLGRKFRLDIAAAAAQASGIPEEILAKRGAFFPRSGRGGAYGVISFLTVQLPTILLNPTQDSGGVKAPTRYIPGAFIRDAKRFGSSSRREFVFKRKTSKRYPISEVKESTYRPILEAIERLEPSIQSFLKAELEREFARGFL